MPNMPSYRLPRTVTPNRYDLEIVPDLVEGTFSGSVRIALTVLETVRTITLNAVELDLRDVAVVPAGSPALDGTVDPDPDHEQATLRFARDLPPGSAELRLHFDGRLNESLRGFYRIRSEGADGTPVFIGATQFEATDARRAFPCWDEPDFKAVFQVTLVIDEGLVALSNGPEISASPEGTRRRVRFRETIPMSTYLVAWVVGPLACTPPVEVGVPIRIVARPELMALTPFAATASEATLKYFTDYFGIPCPADKMDHVAIPDFAAGAMENLGLVTYREEALLVDPARSSPPEQRWVFEVIAHETAHMWFGDLVTMRWWNGIWLNEAFATFMAETATAHLRPQWDVETTNALSQAAAMAIDGLESTRAIEFPVGPPEEAQEMFDVLTYDKGSAILRMLQKYLGSAVFRDGIRAYLSRHRYGNTETSDLWEALQEASGEPVRRVMEAWIFQGGYPLVEARREHDTLVLRQRAFRYQGTSDAVWPVPVVVRIDQGGGRSTTESLLLDDGEVRRPLPPDTTYVVVNDGASGFYRVWYDDALRQGLLTHLTACSPRERIAVAEDAWAQVLAGMTELRSVVPVWQRMQEETHPDVWGALAPHLDLLDLAGTETDRERLARFVCAIAGPGFARLGWDPEPDEDLQQGRLRANLLSLLGTVGQDRAVADEAVRRFWAHMDGSRPVAPALLTAVVHVAAAHGGAREWERMVEAYEHAATPQDENRYLYALANVTRPELAERTVALYCSDRVRVQHQPLALGRALGRRGTQRAAWEAIEGRWPEFQKRFPPSLLARVVLPVSSILEPDLAAKARAFVERHPLPEARRATAQALEFQAIHRRLRDRVHGRMGGALT